MEKKNYIIAVPIKGIACLEVTAESEEQAIEIAKKSKNWGQDGYAWMWDTSQMATIGVDDAFDHSTEEYVYGYNGDTSCTNGTINWELMKEHGWTLYL